MIPFSFKLPQYVPFPDNLAEPLLRLPPSLEAGKLVVDSYGRPCMQPLIEYAVRAVVTVPAPASPHSTELQQSHKFIFIPFTELDPPLEQADFPKEFTRSSASRLRKRSLASPIGEFSITMDEPEPLRILNVGGKDCGRAWIRLAFQPSLITDSQPRLERWECVLESQVRIKTFYSTMPLHEMASNCLARANRHLRVRSEVIGLKPRDANLHLSTFTREPIDGDLRPPGRFLYSSRLLLPIDVADDLLPTFCSLMAARRYTLRVSLTIKGLHHQPMQVEVPLQVCYCNYTENQTDELSRKVEYAPCSAGLQKSIRTSILDESGSIEVSALLTSFRAHFLTN